MVACLVGYFVFWVIATVVYERGTVLNDPRLLARFGVAEYQVNIEPKSSAGIKNR